MSTLLKVGLLGSLLLAAQTCLFAQATAAAVSTPGCENAHRVVAPKNPRVGSDGEIISGQAIVQMTLALDERTTITVVDYPSVGKHLDSYNSTIVVHRGQGIKKYSLKELVKGGEVLRLVEMARVCSSPDRGSVFLAFEAGSTGAAEGFAVVRYSPQTIEVQGLPLADQGRIVVKAAAPDQVELWSARDDGIGGIECDACKKYYAVEDCEIGGPSVLCSKRQGAGGSFSPDKFMRARIEVR